MSLFLALEADGAGGHPAAWRFSGRAPADVLHPAAIRDVVRAAETAGFALVTFADSPLPPGPPSEVAGRLEAGGRAAYLSTLTRRIGLAPTIPAATTEPFHVAAQLATLDHASHGRAAWVVAEADDAELATIGSAPAAVPPSETADVVEVVRRLWDSWEDDAVIKDVATGRYLDPDKVHHVDFAGPGFSVKGPLITPRPPQGQPVVLAPDSVSADADVALVTGPDLKTIARRAEAARGNGVPLVFADLDVVLDAAEPAAVRLAALDRSAPWASDRWRHVGSPGDLVQLLSEVATVADGVRLHPAVLAVDLPILTAEVLPSLPLAPPRETLRATFGLSRPANRFAEAHHG